MSKRPKGGSCGSLALLALAAAAHASDATDLRVDEPHAATCLSLGGDEQRLAAKFALLRAGCALSGAPAATRAARQSQQLYLYDTQGVSASLLDTPSATPPRGPGRSAKQRLPTPAQRALQLAPTVDASARSHDIDPLLLHAIARVESRHDAAAISSAGALGVMQVMPATANRFGATASQVLHDAPTNVEVGAAYLKTLQQRFGNDLVLVLAAYNAGEGAVERHGRQVPPYPETQVYVRQVLSEYALLRRASAQVARQHKQTSVAEVAK